MKRLLAIPILALALSESASAQCVMCFRTAHAQNQARSRVMNAGILVLGVPPLIILAGFAILVRKRSRIDDSDS